MPLPLTPTLGGALTGLVTEFDGIFPAATVEQVLLDSHERLRPAQVEAFLPLLAARFARERLRAASRPAPGPTAPDDRPALVLFVCGANTGRSQLAAALLQHRARGRVHAVSAGVDTGREVQPEVATALTEVGVDPSGLYPKPITPEVVAGADVVVTLGCLDVLDLDGSPRRHLDWDVADPAGSDLEVVRAVRDELAHRVDTLLTELIGDEPGPLR